MTTKDEGGYDPAVHLSYADTALDDPRKQSFLRITIKQSKTDQFRKGMDLYVGRMGTDLCPVAAVFSHLTHTGSVSGPLFVFKSGIYLTWKQFVDRVCGALGQIDIKQWKYCDHGFHIKAATKGIEKCYQDPRPVGKCSIQVRHS